MTLPNGRADTIEFFELHLPEWALDPAGIGLSAAEVAELQGLVQEARADLAAAEESRLAAKAATLRLHLSADGLRRKGQVAIDRIRTTAQATGDAGVYTAASIDPPRVPRAVGAPGVPTSFRQSLDQGGVLTLAWKSVNSKPSTGAVFTIARQVIPAGAAGDAAARLPFEIVGAVPARTFTDASIPAGAAAVTYRVQGRRGGAMGEAAFFTVRFGVAVQAGAARLAA